MTKGNKGYTREGNSIHKWNSKLRLIIVFKKKNPNLSLHVAQGLEVGHINRLCPNNITFCENLQHAYGMHN
jgi:hypothetical protein